MLARPIGNVLSIVLFLQFGAWLSLAERLVRDQEVGGSNPLAPTIFLNDMMMQQGIRLQTMRAGAVQALLLVVLVAVLGGMPSGSA